jgi:threonine synthase
MLWPCTAADKEVIEGMKLFAEAEGIFAEPAGGVVIAGLRMLAPSRIIKKNELTVAFVTGAGPKTQEVIAERVHPFVIQPTLESFEEVLGLVGSSL